jgi:hypothetical protein
MEMSDVYTRIYFDWPTLSAGFIGNKSATGGTSYLVGDLHARYPRNQHQAISFSRHDIGYSDKKRQSHLRAEAAHARSCVAT